jgi:hypothetical protein
MTREHDNLGVDPVRRLLPAELGTQPAPRSGLSRPGGSGHGRSGIAHEDPAGTPSPGTPGTETSAIAR